MKMKKLILASLLVFVVIAVPVKSFAAKRKIGQLSKINITQEDFDKLILKNPEAKKFLVFIAGENFELETKFYYSLISLLMALNSGAVDRIILPKDVAEYVLKTNKNYKTVAILRAKERLLFSYSFGFRENDNKNLRNKFNEALRQIKNDKILLSIRDKYIKAGVTEPKPVKFEKFKNAEKIKVAVTGDLPPIDYIAPDGTPAGFNTAVISEIGKRLKINIDLVNIEAGARASALASGRVDAVFWMEHTDGMSFQVDVPDGIVLSEPYYNWDTHLCIELRK